jgi:hypothetical protein
MRESVTMEGRVPVCYPMMRTMRVPYSKRQTKREATWLWL